MSATFIVVPEWQGSVSSRAMRLVDGALAIAGDLPTASTVRVEIPLEAGEAQDSRVARFTALQLVRDRQLQALANVDDWALTIGGDCGVALAAVAHVADTNDVALVWFDAHPDLNTPETSPSASFGGMVLRTLLGDGAAGLVPARPLSADHVVLVGSRSYDDAEEAYLPESGIRVLEGETVDPAALAAAVKATGASSVYIHVDLDVLDPPEFGGVGEPQPFGLSAKNVVELIRAAKSALPLVGAGIAGFAPASDEQAIDDLPTILRIIGALTS